MIACNQCGKCCIKYGGNGLDLTQEEINMWELFNPEIFNYVKDDQVWFDPHSGLRLEYCPFLSVVPSSESSSPVRYACDIYFNRPEDCRLYPSHISEMVRDECEMIEPSDLDNTGKAQKNLDAIMIESRTIY